MRVGQGGKRRWKSREKGEGRTEERGGRGREEKMKRLRKRGMGKVVERRGGQGRKRGWKRREGGRKN